VLAMMRQPSYDNWHDTSDLHPQPSYPRKLSPCPSTKAFVR
jgi:hypothetical protein